jgi:hypothetical protein
LVSGIAKALRRSQVARNADGGSMRVWRALLRRCRRRDRGKPKRRAETGPFEQLNSHL